MTPDLSPIRNSYPFKSNYLNLKGLHYHYIDEGSGPVMLMLHGNPTWSFFYRRLISYFSQTHRVIAPDHLGCGLSDKPQDYEYRLETHIDNLENLVSSLGLDKITLVVHDWGGAIGMGFAVRFPHRIKSIVILNSAAFSIDYIPWRIAACRIPVLGEFMVRRLNAFSLGAVKMAVRKPLSKEAVDGFLLPYKTYEDRIAVYEFIKDIPMSPEDASYEVLLEIEHGLWMFRENPVCIIWGMKDWCFNTRFLERWKLYYPQASVYELQNASHYLIEDEPEKVISYIDNFLETHAEPIQESHEKSSE